MKTGSISDTLATTKAIQIPWQPGVGSALLNAWPSLEKVAEVIATDPLLTACVMKIHQLALKRQIQAGGEPAIVQPRSITEWVESLGSEAVHAVIHSALLMSAERQTFQVEQLTPFWHTSQRAAMACAMCARQLNLDCVEKAYCLGLFHNIGMVFMHEKHPEYFETLYLNNSDNLSLIQLESHLYKADHATVGFYCSKGWLMDSIIGRCIRDHHLGADHGLYDNNSEEATLLSLLKLAEQMTEESLELIQQDCYPEWPELKPQIYNTLGITDLDYMDLNEIVQEQMYQLDTRQSH